MSEDNSKSSPWTNPQVVVAVIGLIGTIVATTVGLVPLFLDKKDSTPVPPPTATQFVATPIPFNDVTDAPATPTDVPQEVPTSDDLAIPNIEILFDDVSFTVHSISSATLSLQGVTFRSSTGQWQATQWGTIVNSVPANNCLRLRDANSGQRQPPAVCGNLLGLQLVSGSALFWLNVPTFDVVHNGTVIAVCSTASSPCLVAIP